MGYSGRYHAASLVAVFIALAIGIVIGVGLADDVVSTANDELVDSLNNDLDEAEAQLEDSELALERERDFSSRAYPALVSGELAGSSVAVVGVGELDDDTEAAVEEALAPTGAELAAKAVIAAPPDAAALADAAGPAFTNARRGGAELERLGRKIGAELSGGSRLIDNVGSSLFTRFSGDLQDVNRIIVAPGDLGEIEGAAFDDTETLLDGLYAGIDAGSANSVAVEVIGIDPSRLGQASAAGIATVDHADLIAGRLAIIEALLGAEGDFGVKDEDDSYLPELVDPAAGPTEGTASGAADGNRP